MGASDPRYSPAQAEQQGRGNTRAVHSHHRIDHEAGSPLTRETRRPRSSRVLPRHLRHRYERVLTVVQAESCKMDEDEEQASARQAQSGRSAGYWEPAREFADLAGDPLDRCLVLTLGGFDAFVDPARDLSHLGLGHSACRRRGRA